MSPAGRVLLQKESDFNETKKRNSRTGEARPFLVARLWVNKLGGLETCQMAKLGRFQFWISPIAYQTVTK
jgi:hypothetical protein